MKHKQKKKTKKIVRKKKFSADVLKLLFNWPLKQAQKKHPKQQQQKRQHKNKQEERYCTVIGLQREIDTLSLAISTLHTDFSSTDNGIHLLDVQEKLHKFQLQESQVQPKDLLAVRIVSVTAYSGERNVRDYQKGW